MLTFERANELGAERHPKEWLHYTMTVGNRILLHENSQLIANVILIMLDTFKREQKETANASHFESTSMTPENENDQYPFELMDGEYLIAECGPCPFCGISPVAQPWHGGGPEKRMVACRNIDGCDVLPSVTGETEDEAVSRWNKRSSPLPFHEATEVPDAGRSGWRVSQNEDIAFGQPELHYELYLPQVFSEDTVGWFYESDILNLFHLWKEKQ